jgi:hypothetical protein
VELLDGKRLYKAIRFVVLWSSLSPFRKFKPATQATSI